MYCGRPQIFPVYGSDARISRQLHFAHSLGCRSGRSRMCTLFRWRAIRQAFVGDFLYLISSCTPYATAVLHVPAG